MTASTPIEWPNTAMWWAAVVTKVHDGDTVTLDIDLNRYVKSRKSALDLGFHLHVVHNHLRLHNATRLYGINAPELNTPEGKTARAALAAQLPLGKPVTVTTWLNKADKYGRVLGAVWLSDDMSANQWMLDHGHASSYYGIGPKS